MNVVASTVTGSVTTAPQGQPGSRKATPGADASLFANLLASVGHTDPQSAEAAADDATPLKAAAGADPTDPTDTTELASTRAAQEDAQSALINLLSWSRPQGTNAPESLGASAGLAPAEGLSVEADAAPASPSTAPLLGEQRTRGATGIDISGLLPVAESAADALDTQTLSLAATPKDADAAPKTTAPGNAALRASGLAGQPVAGSTAPASERALTTTAATQARVLARESFVSTPPTPAPAAIQPSRSTVALDSRSPKSSPPTGLSTRVTAADSVAPTLSLSAADHSRQRTSSLAATTPTTMVDAGFAPLPDLAPRDSASSSSSLPADALATTTPDAEPPAASHLGTHVLRHASLRVGDGGADAIDVQLSIKGQEVNVDFRTNSAETRHGLQHSAAPALGELLERNGMQLGGVSVGGQGLASGGGQGSGAQPERRPATPAAASTRGDERSAPVTDTASRPRADGSRPLDVFA